MSLPKQENAWCRIIKCKESGTNGSVCKCDTRYSTNVVSVCLFVCAWQTKQRKWNIKWFKKCRYRERKEELEKSYVGRQSFYHYIVTLI